MMNRKSPYAWLFLSGAIALTLEVLWTRYFQILLGNTVYSFSWVTGAFLLGISLGSYLGGFFVTSINSQKDKRASSLLNAYILSEVAVILFTILSFSILLAPPSSLVSFLSPKHFLKDGLVCLGLILPCTISMGIGLPLLTQRFGNDLNLEKLYAFNTLGGGLGLLVLSFFGLIYLGYIGLLYVLLSLNLILILYVFFFKATAKDDEGLLKNEDNNAKEHKKGKYLILSFLSGFLLLGLEAVWFRTTELILNDRTYVTTLVLFIVLTLLGISSYLTPKIKKALPRFLRYFLYAGLLSLVAAELISDSAFLIARDFPRITPEKISYMILVFILPLFFFSFIFPRILIDKKWSGKSVADLIFANTLGGLIGTLLVSYIFIGTFGMKSFYWAALILMPLFLFLDNDVPIKENKLFLSLFAIPIILFGMFFKNTIYIHKKPQVIQTQELPQGLFSLIKSNKEKLEMYNGNYRIVAPYKAANGEHAQKALAFFPALYNENPKSILTMGTGYGISIAAFLKLKPTQLDTVEVHPMVNQVSPYFKELNDEWYLNPAVEIYIDDARGFLSRNKNTYDLISSNIASPYTTSGSLFLTKEYFNTVKERLNENGVYSQLVWGPHLVEIVHTFKSVFPHIAAYPGYDETDIVLIGSKSPLNLKRNISSFDSQWPFYDGHKNREVTLALGQNILKKAIETKPEFIISDHTAVLTHNFSRGLNFFWIHH